jgi:LysM repeat protein
MKRLSLFGALLAVTASALVSLGGNASAMAGPATTQVQPGDTLSSIAGRYETTYKRIFNANPDILDPNVIFAGETIRIPSADEQLPDRETDRPVPLPTPIPEPKPPVVVAPASADIWDKLAQCESNGNWSANTGNGYFGGLQFRQSTWDANGGAGVPSAASREQQIEVGRKVQASQGWKAWPTCSAKLGLL